MRALNRIVTALLAAAVLPAAFFADIISIRVNTSLSSYVIEENVSLQRAIELFSPGGLLDGTISQGFPEALSPLKGNLVAFAVFFALAALVALVTVFFAALTDCTKTVTALCAGGVVCMIAARIAFSAVTSAVAEGLITLGSLTGSSWFNLLGNISVVSLSSAPTLMTVLFVSALIWNAAFLAINMGEEPKKKSGAMRRAK